MEENTFPYKLIYNKKKEFLLGDKLINSGISWTFVIRDFFLPSSFSVDEMLKHRMTVGISFDVKYRLPNCFYDELVFSSFNTNADGMGNTTNLYGAKENPLIAIRKEDNSMLVYSGVGIAKVTSINSSNFNYEIKYAEDIEAVSTSNGGAVIDVKRFCRITIKRDEKSIYLIRNTKKGIEISIVEW